MPTPQRYTRRPAAPYRKSNVPRPWGFRPGVKLNPSRVTDLRGQSSFAKVGRRLIGIGK